MRTYNGRKLTCGTFNEFGRLVHTPEAYYAGATESMRGVQCSPRGQRTDWFWEPSQRHNKEKFEFSSVEPKCGGLGNFCKFPLCLSEWFLIAIVSEQTASHIQNRIFWGLHSNLESLKRVPMRGVFTSKRQSSLRLWPAHIMSLGLVGRHLKKALPVKTSFTKAVKAPNSSRKLTSTFQARCYATDSPTKCT